MSRRKICSKVTTFMELGTLGLGIACFCKHCKMTSAKYQETCLYMAVLDDEICRRELNGIVIGERTISFPSKRKSLYHRYQVFLEMNCGLCRKALEKEVLKLEQRLAKCKQNGHDME